MMTNFKIFENDTKTKLYYHIMKNDDLKKYYNKLKKTGLQIVFLEIPGSDYEISLICHMSEEDKNNNFFKNWYWGEDINTIAHIMVNFTPVDPVKFLKDCEIRKNAKKYNL